MDDDHELALQVHREINTRARVSTRVKDTATFCRKKQDALTIRKLTTILKKPQESRSSAQQAVIDHEDPLLVEEALKRLQKRNVQVSRLEEQEDPEEVLEEKCRELTDILKSSKHLVVYTGAGISTAASIPDYRGPQGIWTMLRKGQDLDADNCTLTSANPTVTHMAIFELYRQGLIKHVVSQNCDGLHLRSGIPRSALSEVHGNMYVEVCSQCEREYVRTFDVTENTRRRDHRTGRICYACGSVLKDTIVHFGERGSIKWPLNWAGAERSAEQADVILCLGSSLKVLRRYPWLWCMGKTAQQRPILCIVNLQWTPKDQGARLKINGKCDQVITRLMELLEVEIPSYSRTLDPLISISTPLNTSELESKTTVELHVPDCSDNHSCIRSGPPLCDDNYKPFSPVFATEMLQTSAVIYSKTRVRKGKGTGWLGNAWGVRPKRQKKKKTAGKV